MIGLRKLHRNASGLSGYHRFFFPEGFGHGESEALPQQFLDDHITAALKSVDPHAANSAGLLLLWVTSSSLLSFGDPPTPVLCAETAQWAFLYLENTQSCSPRLRLRMECKEKADGGYSRCRDLQIEKFMC